MNPIEQIRHELALNNPDYRRVCGLLADAIEENQAEAVEIHVPDEVPLNTRQSLPPVDAAKPSAPPPPQPKKKK